MHVRVGDWASRSQWMRALMAHGVVPGAQDEASSDAADQPATKADADEDAEAGDADTQMSDVQQRLWSLVRRQGCDVCACSTCWLVWSRVLVGPGCGQTHGRYGDVAWCLGPDGSMDSPDSVLHVANNVNQLEEAYRAGFMALLRGRSSTAPPANCPEPCAWLPTTALPSHQASALWTIMKAFSTATPSVGPSTCVPAVVGTVVPHLPWVRGVLVCCGAVHWQAPTRARRREFPDL